MCVCVCFFVSGALGRCEGFGFEWAMAAASGAFA